MINLFNDIKIRQIIGSVFSLISKCMFRVLFTAFVCMVFTVSVLSQESDPFETLVLNRACLMKNKCDLDCSKKVAAMYSQEFLERNKESLIITLRNSTDRVNDARILFGKAIEQSELEQMPPVDVFANQLVDIAQSIPPEYRYSKTEILRKKRISINEVIVIVRNYDLPGSPHMEDEEAIHFIKEDGKWKFRN